MKGLIISNVVPSIPDYNSYFEEVIFKTMDNDVLTEMKELEAAGDTENPRYMELLIPHHYEKHMIRMPSEDWPVPVNRAFHNLNLDINL